MSFHFATCERDRAMGFLRKLYPSYDLSDDANSAGPLLDLVEADVVRVCDPDFHNQGMVGGKAYWDSDHERVQQTINAFHKRIGL